MIDPTRLPRVIEVYERWMSNVNDRYYEPFGALLREADLHPETEPRWTFHILMLWAADVNALPDPVLPTTLLPEDFITIDCEQGVNIQTVPATFRIKDIELIMGYEHPTLYLYSKNMLRVTTESAIEAGLLKRITND